LAAYSRAWRLLTGVLVCQRGSSTPRSMMPDSTRRVCSGGWLAFGASKRAAARRALAARAGQYPLFPRQETSLDLCTFAGLQAPDFGLRFDMSRDHRRPGTARSVSRAGTSATPSCSTTMRPPASDSEDRGRSKKGYQGSLPF
jgi:hypothetical protein